MLITVPGKPTQSHLSPSRSGVRARAPSAGRAAPQPDASWARISASTDDRSMVGAVVQAAHVTPVPPCTAPTCGGGLATLGRASPSAGRAASEPATTWAIKPASAAGPARPSRLRRAPTTHAIGHRRAREYGMPDGRNLAHVAAQGARTQLRRPASGAATNSRRHLQRACAAAASRT